MSTKKSKGTIIHTHIPFKDMLFLNKLGRQLRSESRSSLDDDLVQGTRELVGFAEARRVLIMKKGENLFRARTNPDQRDKVPLPKEKMGAPPAKKTSPGRVNPEGIAFLYTATDAATAITEIRPWLRARVSVARFTVDRDLRLVDGSGDAPKSDVETVGFEGADQSWEQLISTYFSIPIEPGETQDYLLSQYFAEAFMNVGFDGIKYASKLTASNGSNVALFDLKAATPVETELVIVDAVKYVWHSLSKQSAPG